MDVLFVCDNRDHLNWGCRATSIALEEILEPEHHVCARIGRAEINRRIGHVPSTGSPVLADRVLPRLGRLAESGTKGVTATATNQGAPPPERPGVRRRLAGGVLRVLGLAGIRADFVSTDPSVTATRIIAGAGRPGMLRSLLERVEAADLVLVNGEGSLILREPPRRDLLLQLGVLELARRRGVATAYVNAMVSDCPITGRSSATARVVEAALEQCDTVVLRDPLSLEVLAEVAPAVEARHLPDALFSWDRLLADPRSLLPANPEALVPFPEQMSLRELDLGAPYIAVSGGSVAGWDQRAATASYVAVVEGLAALGLPIVLVETCTGDQFLRDVGAEVGVMVVPVQVPIRQGAGILASADVFVSGRYHPSILAALGGTPSVSMQGNSHKMQALRAMLGFDPGVFSARPGPDEVPAVVEAAAAAITGGRTARQALRARASVLADDARQLASLLCSEAPRAFASAEASP